MFMYKLHFKETQKCMRHAMTPTYIHKLNLGVKMSYNMSHALNTMFCLLSVSCLVGELFLLTHDRFANSMLYK